MGKGPERSLSESSRVERFLRSQMAGGIGPVMFCAGSDILVTEPSVQRIPAQLQWSRAPELLQEPRAEGFPQPAFIFRRVCFSSSCDVIWDVDLGRRDEERRRVSKEMIGGILEGKAWMDGDFDFGAI